MHHHDDALSLHKVNKRRQLAFERAFSCRRPKRAEEGALQAKTKGILGSFGRGIR